MQSILCAVAILSVCLFVSVVSLSVPHSCGLCQNGWTIPTIEFLCTKYFDKIPTLVNGKGIMYMYGIKKLQL